MNRHIHIYIAAVLIGLNHLAMPGMTTSSSDEAPPPQHLAPVSLFAHNSATISMFKSEHGSGDWTTDLVQAWDKKLATLKTHGWRGKSFCLFVEYTPTTLQAAMDEALIKGKIPFYYPDEGPLPEYIKQHRRTLMESYETLVTQAIKRTKDTLRRRNTSRLPTCLSFLSPFLEKHQGAAQVTLAPVPPRAWLHLELARAWMERYQACLQQGNLDEAFKGIMQYLKELQAGVSLSDKKNAHRVLAMHKNFPQLPVIGLMGSLHSIQTHLPGNGYYEEIMLGEKLSQPLAIAYQNLQRLDEDTFLYLMLRHMVSEPLEHFFKSGGISASVARALAIAIAFRMDDKSIEWVYQMIQEYPLNREQFLPSLYNYIRTRQHNTGKRFIMPQEVMLIREPSKEREQRLSIEIPYQIAASA